MISERRKKQLIAYALRSAPMSDSEARKRFIKAYREAIRIAPVPIAPEDDEDFAKAVSALETDKAFYEVRYELSSRPDWAWLPLDSLK